MPLHKVFEPIRIGPVELPNRIVRTAHGKGEPTKRLSEESVAYHAARAKGGCGLSILGAASVHPSSKLFMDAVFRDSVIDDYGRLVAATRPHGMKIFAQLWHGGNLYDAFDGGPGWAVSDRPGILGKTPVRMTDAMIWELVEAYAQCAVRVRDGGLDGVEVHSAHGYLPQQFLSTVYNDRTDRWGGSFENRTRFLREVLRAIRRAIGSDIAISVRLSASEMPGGIDIQENRDVLRLLEQENLIDMVNVSCGDYYRADTMVGAMHNPTGYEIPSSAEIAAAATVPRLLAGRYRTLDDAEELLRSGAADLVSMVRAQIADPDLVRKTQEGRALEVRPCIGCNQHGRGGRFGCAVNPAAGAELTLSEELIAPVTKPRKVLVVGGGPAGLEAARVAALMGHDVTLCEASPELGGMLNVARRAPQSAGFGDIAVWLEQEVYRLGVDVRLNTYMEPDDVAAEAADHLIVATGSLPRQDGWQFVHPTLSVAGVGQPHVVTAIDLLRTQREWGETAVVLDTVGDYEGLAATEHLLRHGAKVTFVTPGVSMAPKSERHWSAFERFQQLGEFDVLTRHLLVEVRKDDVLVRGHLAPEQQVRAVRADTVVLITPNQPLREICEALEGRHPDMHIVGDARQPRDLLWAMWEGHGAARRLV